MLPRGECWQIVSDEHVSAAYLPEDREPNSYPAEDSIFSSVNNGTENAPFSLQVGRGFGKLSDEFKHWKALLLCLQRKTRLKK